MANHFPLKWKEDIDPNNIKKCLKIMKNIYTYFKCSHANEIPITEFNEEIQYILKRSFLLFYFYYYGNDLKILIASHSFLKLLAK